MFIQNVNKYISQIIHNNTVHKVVEGIADVPKEVRDHLTQFPEWSDIVEPVKKEVIDELHKIEETVQSSADDSEKSDGKAKDKKDTNPAENK